MADAGKYGQVTIPNVPDDEPVFIVRAQDEYGIDTLKDYLAYPENTSVVEGVEERLVAFEAWADTHPTKEPD